MLVSVDRYFNIEYIREYIMLKSVIEKMWLLIAIIVLCYSCAAQANDKRMINEGTTCAPGFGQSSQLHDWFFHLGDVTLGGRESLDHSQWQKVTVPHDWSVAYPASPDKASCTGYLPGGIAWYRTDIPISATQTAKRMYLYFEGVYNKSEVFFNGKWLGKRPNGYVSFLYDITAYVKAGKKNVVAVRVDHSQDADSRWYTGSGIYRDAHLVTASPIHIGLWGVGYTATLINSQMATVDIATNIENHEASEASIHVTHQLIDPGGMSVSTQSKTISVAANAPNTVAMQLEVNNPKLWGLEQPNLYTLKTTLEKDGKVVDENTTKVGIRSLTFDANRGFALNGHWLKIKGVCLHHDAGVLGAAVPKQVWHDRLVKLKEIGCNGIRTSHNPQATDLYDLCDELGLLVIDEAFDEWEYPKKKWIKGWNIGDPGFQGAADYFREWGLRDLQSIVKRDRNHPSIIMWSIGNEVDYPNDPYSHPVLDSKGIGQYHVSGYKKNQPHADRLGDIAKELAAEVRKIDTSRPVTAALAGAVMSNETDYPGALDVVGYNYTESRYKIDHEKYPQRILYGSETRHDLAAWKAVTDNDYIFGQFIWTGFDYLGEAGPYPSRGFTTGMVDLANNIKPRGYWRKALWSDEPMAYVGTYPTKGNSKRLSIDAGQNWNYQDGQLIRVVCYTNGDEAELLLNGKVVGGKKPYNHEQAIIHWDIPFEPGVLSVVAYEKGEKVAVDEIKTSARPYGIEVSATKPVLTGKMDVAVIRLRIVDENGNLVYLADNEVTCSVKGPARLLGLENASNNVAENFRTNTLRCKNGRLVAYLQATAESGQVEVGFTSTLLRNADITINCRSGRH